MVTIEINNSTSKINGLTSIPFNKLRKALSYSIDSQAAFFSKNRFNTTRYCIDKHGTFATGLLKRVVEFLDISHIKYELKDKRIESILKIRKVDHKFQSSLVPYKAQIDAAASITKNHRGILSMPTGAGKSHVIALIIARLCVRTLIVVPSLQIKEQLKESLSRSFKDTSNIVIENIDSNALNTAKGFGCLIIDEGHHAAAKTYQKLNKTAWKDIYYRVFLTATPFRNQTEETLLFEGIAGQVVYKLTFAQSVEKGYIVPIEAYYIEVDKVKTDSFTYQEVYSEFVTNNEAKNQIIAKTLLNLGLSGASTLCLVKEIRHGSILAEMTGLPFANGQDDTTREYIEQFNKGEIKVLIGTEGILSEGVDTKPCEFVLIAGLGKAKSSFMQKIGRCVRVFPGKESGKVIIIRDGSHRFLLRHFNEQKKILLEEYGIIPIKLSI